MSEMTTEEIVFKLGDLVNFASKRLQTLQADYRRVDGKNQSLDIEIIKLQAENRHLKTATRVLMYQDTIDQLTTEVARLREALHQVVREWNHGDAGYLAMKIANKALNL